jgi:hypothetical protein
MSYLLYALCIYRSNIPEGKFLLWDNRGNLLSAARHDVRSFHTMHQIRMLLAHTFVSKLYGL